MKSHYRPKSRCETQEGRPLWAFVADLEQSRKVRNRASLSKQLERELAYLQGDKAPGRLAARGHRPQPEAWLAPLESVRGIDELSGVCRTPGVALAAAFHLTLALWPHRFRFALARGPLDVGLETGEAGAIDGPAFHLAADALARAHEEKRPLTFTVPEWEPAAVAALEDAFGLHRAFTKEWTKRQREVVQAWYRHETQHEVAKVLGISQSTVSETLDRAHALELLALETSLPAHLDWLDTLSPPA